MNGSAGTRMATSLRPSSQETGPESLNPMTTVSDPGTRSEASNRRAFAVTVTPRVSRSDPDATMTGRFTLRGRRLMANRRTAASSLRGLTARP